MILRIAELLNKSKKEKGFTLIELLIVVAILGILAAVAVPNFMQALDRGRVGADVATAESIGNAVRLYQVQEEEWPAPIPGLVTDIDALAPNYLETVDLTPEQTNKTGFWVSRTDKNIIEVVVTP